MDLFVRLRKQFLQHPLSFSLVYECMYFADLLAEDDLDEVLTVCM